MAYESYNPRTGVTTYSQIPPAGLSAAQQATLAEGVKTQATVNANNYQIMQAAGATPQQTLAAMGGTNGATSVSGLNTQQNALLAPELTKYNAGIMSNPAVVQAVDKTITSALPSAVLGGESKAQLPQMKSANEKLAIDAFNKNYVQGQVGAAPKIVQPTGQEGYLKMRDIGAEQKGISLFEQTQKRKPTTSADWALINNAIYGQATPPLRGGTLPGAKGDGGVSDTPPDPSVTGEDGTIDQAKLQATAEQELAQTKRDLEAAIAESDAYNSTTEASTQAIGQQLGVVAPLLQGEALALDQQRALGAKTLEIKIARLEQKKQSLKEEVAQYRQDQQQAFVNFMNLATKTGLSSKAMTPEMLKAFETQSKLTGIPTSMYAQSLDAIYQSRIASEALEVAEAGKVSATTKANMIASLVSTGLSVEEATSKVSQILGASSGTGSTGSAGTGTTGTGQTFGAVGSGAGGMRTDRHNNPVAMTTDVAKTLGLIEGKDYTKGDAFPNNPNLFTARLAGDGVATTIKGLDMAASDPKKQAFYTQGGQQRWTHTAMSDQQWLAMTPEQKRAAVGQMYQREGGDGSLFGGTSGQTTVPTNVASKYSPEVINAAERIKNGELSVDDASIKPIAANVRKYMDEAKISIPLTEQQIKTIEASPEGKLIKSNINLKQKLSNYQALVDEYGTELYGAKAALLEAAYAEAKIAWKEAANLGALTGPDVAIIQDAMKATTGIEGKKNALIYGEQGIKDSIKSAITALLNATSSNIKLLEAKNKNYSNSDYIKELKRQAGILSAGQTGTAPSGITYTIKK